MSKDMLDAIASIRNTDRKDSDLLYLKANYLEQASNNTLLDYLSIYKAMVFLSNMDSEKEKKKREIAFCCISDQNLVTNNNIMSILNEIKSLNEDEIEPNKCHSYEKRYAVMHAIDNFVSNKEFVEAAKEIIRRMSLDKIELMYDHINELPIMFSLYFNPRTGINPRMVENKGKQSFNI